jgi:hypothetical protein
VNLKLSELAAGVYVGLRVIDAGNDRLREYAAANNLPNPVTAKERRLHVTVIYSRVGAPIQAQPELVHLARPVGFDIFSSSEGANALVLRLSAPTVEARHRQLMSTYPLTYDYPTFKPHITLSYDVGKLDPGTLPLFQEEILLGAEYVEELRP